MRMKWKKAIDEDKDFQENLVPDFETDKYYIMRIACIKINYNSSINRLYILWVLLSILFVVIMHLISTSRLESSILSAESLHWAVLFSVIIITISVRYVFRIDGAMDLMKEGFYTYHDAFQDERFFSVRKFHDRRARLVNMCYRILAVVIGATLSSVQYMKRRELSEHDKEIINPDFPLTMYFPFDTTSGFGYVFGYFFNIVPIFYLIVTMPSALNVLLTLVEYLIAQYKILDMSVTNVQNRAYYNYIKDNTAQERYSMSVINHRPEFQEYIYQCLRENAIHHQCLLKYTHVMSKYIKPLFLTAVFFSSVMYASLILIIMDSDEVFEISILIILAVGEILYVYFFTLYGEILKNQSSKLFFSLWDTPLWNFDKRNRTLIGIMMVKAMHPVIIKTLGINTGMTLESFGEIMRAAYQFMSVVRKVKN